jgi:hypothetical protein
MCAATQSPEHRLNKASLLLAELAKTPMAYAIVPLVTLHSTATFSPTFQGNVGLRLNRAYHLQNIRYILL